VNKPRYLVIFAVVGVIAFVYWSNPVVITFGKYSAADFTQQLTPLVLISLFIERSLEIFITVWRGGRAAELQAALDSAKALPETDPAKIDSVKVANDSLTKYRFATQQITLPSGLFLGILIATLGVRGLGNFAQVDKITNYVQRDAFNVVDVLLTGAVMGGGSDFMHRLITTFTDLMDATSQKAKAAVP
jgi:hypothetical protein